MYKYKRTKVHNMSLSISKLMELVGDKPKQTNNLKQGDIPDRSNVTLSQYYLSVRKQPKNSQNILQKGTPDGQSANREDPKGFAIDGSIDPNYIRGKTDPTSAQPFRYYEGGEGRLYELPPTAYKSSNSVDLIRAAKQSYYNRMSMYEPKQKNSSSSESPIVPTSELQAAQVGGSTNNTSIKNDLLFA